MSFVDVPNTTVVESEIDPALADKMAASDLAGANRLRTLRKERSLSTVDLARISGIPRDEIVAIENGKPFGALELHAISAALDVPAEQLSEQE